MMGMIRRIGEPLAGQWLVVETAADLEWSPFDDPGDGPVEDVMRDALVGCNFGGVVLIL